MFKTTEDSRIQISELMIPSNANFGGKIHVLRRLRVKIKLIINKLN